MFFVITAIHVTSYTARVSFIFTLQTGSEKCEPCGPGKYPNDDHSKCIPCPEGAYCVNGIPKYCKTGEIVLNPKTSSCKKCGNGRFPNKRKDACIPCNQPGFVSDGQGSCRRCGNDQVPNEARTACDPCPIGSYCLDGIPYQCETGHIVKNRSCQVCRKGSYPNDVKDQCILCATGGYCPYPKKQNGGFEPCPSGTYNPQRGASAKVACVKCDEGFYSPKPGGKCTMYSPIFKYFSTLFLTKIDYPRTLL